MREQFSIAEQNTIPALEALITQWRMIDPIDMNKAVEIALAAIRYYDGDQSARGKLREFQALEKRWYHSLEKGTPDFSVYSDRYIISDLWACWIVYSRKYLLALKSPKALPDFRGSIVSDMNNIESIADLGCGFGYTTAGLKSLFPDAKVYGTNLKGIQWDIASRFGKRFGFGMRESIHQIEHQVDFIFASEYFEHFESPVEHLIDVLTTSTPEFLIIANAFGAESIGHFRRYRHYGRLVEPKQISRIFNGTLRDAGYRKIETTFWNQRPAYWRLVS